jgi:UDP-glucose 4-epimerase
MAMGRSKRVYDMLLRMWPLYKLGLWAGMQPLIGSLIKPVFSSKIHQVTMIPVHEAIDQGNQMVLPFSLLNQWVEQTSSRFIMTECVCRKHEKCQSHPVDLGCLFLGEGAAQIHPSMGRPCNIEQAQMHIRKGMEEGLYPLVAHTMIDAVTLGIPYSRMLTVCFCCECCCAVHRSLRNGPLSIKPIVQRLPGLRIRLNEKCIACGSCFESCPVNAIHFVDTCVEIGEECVGCGICVKDCPHEAIQIEMKKPGDFDGNVSSRMKMYADILYG